MPTADWDTLTPTDGTPGNAYEFGVDVYMGAAWVNIPDITALNPQPQAKTRNRSSYATKGKARPNTYARDMNLSFNVEIVRDDAEQYQDELAYLLTKAQLLNEDNNVRVRVFDTLGGQFAFEGLYSIEYNRPSTGDEDAGWFGFALSSIGGATLIENPVNDAIVPAVVGVTPDGAAVGDTVVIRGLAFTGATAISIDGVAAFTGATVIDDRTIAVEIPAGVSGPAPVIVTGPLGASAPFAYTAAI